MNTPLDKCYTPKLTTLGGSVGDNQNFFNIKLNCEITVDGSLETNNGGNPDGDLEYAETTRSATIVYV